MTARTLHRTLGWVAGIAAILWASSGFIHPILSWTAPRPAIQAPPAATLPADGLVAPGPALEAAGLAETSLVRLVQVEGQPYWFAARPGRDRLVLDARTGVPATGIEEAHAVALACHYAGDAQSPAAGVRLVTAFSQAYPAVNRLLPVWEVRFDRPDGLTLYVDTGLDRLAAVSDDRRRLLLAVFQNVHTLAFLDDVEILRVGLVLALVGAVLATAFAGASMLLSARGAGLYRAHTLAAWVALPLVVMFTVSGLLHLLVTSPLFANPAPAPALFATATLPALPVTAPGVAVADLIASPDERGQPAWRMDAADGVTWHGPTAPLSDEARARGFAGAGPEAPVRLQGRFDAAYGFVNKRLPVWRVETDAGPRFVDVREGLLAAQPETALAGIEGWTFDHLHKWEFLRGLGRTVRDAGTMTAAAIVVLTSLLGILLLTRRWLRRRPAGRVGHA